MITSNFKDSDGYKLQFEEQCPESDRKYFMQQYPKVDNVASKKLHCTTCDVHIGTAPIAEKIIRTHQILSVTQCNTCFAFYVRLLTKSASFSETLSFYFCFRILVNLEKEKMVQSTIADGVVKAVKCSVVQRVLMCSVTNAFVPIFQTRM